MSQIMEALRQAQAQRSGAAASETDAPSAPLESPQRPPKGQRRAWPWILAAALAGGLLAWYGLGPGITVTADHPSTGRQHTA